MKFTTSWRLGSLWVILPLALLAGQLYTQAVFPSGEFYPLADEILALEAIALIYPLIAASAAISAARVRQSGLLEHPTHRRSRLVIALNLSSAAVVVALVSVLATIALYTFSMSRSFSIEWPLLGCIAISGLSYAFLGTALGLRLRAVLAIPLAIILPYLLIAIPPGAVHPLATASDEHQFQLLFDRPDPLPSRRHSLRVVSSGAHSAGVERRRRHGTCSPSRRVRRLLVHRRGHTRRGGPRRGAPSVRTGRLTTWRTSL